MKDRPKRNLVRYCSYLKLVKLLLVFFFQHGCDQKSFGIDVAKLAGVPLQVETRAREILKTLEQNDNILEPAWDEKLAEGKTKKTLKNSSDSEISTDVEVPAIAPHAVQVETELTKALLLLNPESISPRQALEIIYDLQAKARKRSL